MKRFALVLAACSPSGHSSVAARDVPARAIPSGSAGSAIEAPAESSTTLAALLGNADVRRLGFENASRPVLGTAFTEMQAHYPSFVADPIDAVADKFEDHVFRHGHLVFPKIEYNHLETWIYVDFDNIDRATKMQLKVSFKTPAEADTIRSTIVAKWGEPRLVKDDLSKVYELRRADPRVMLERRADAWTLELFF
jgi:hypothetical protein